MDENPVENYEVAAATDSVGNLFEKQELSGDDFIFQQVLTTHSALRFAKFLIILFISLLIEIIPEPCFKKTLATEVFRFPMPA
jgi:hypothetical protein